MPLYKILLVFWLSVTSLPLSAHTEPEDKTIYIAASFYPPYTEETLLNGGFTLDICRAALKHAGYEVEVIFRPWKRALGETAEGRWDALAVAFYSPQRAETMHFSAPIWVAEGAFAAHKDRIHPVATIEDYRDLRIGVEVGAAFQIMMDDRGIQTEAVRQIKQNIQKLLINRLDLMLSAKAYTQYVLNTEFPAEVREQIVLLNPSFNQSDLHLLFSKQRPDYKALTEQFNHGLRIIRENGEFEAILQLHNMQIK